LFVATTAATALTASSTATNKHHQNNGNNYNKQQRQPHMGAYSCSEYAKHLQAVLPWRHACLAHAEAIAAAGQRRLDIIRGPLLAADVFSEAAGAQLFPLVAHYLAVDLVSRCIIAGDLARTDSCRKQRAAKHLSGSYLTATVGHSRTSTYPHRYAYTRRLQLRLESLE
jgi:hypothetical protein